MSSANWQRLRYQTKTPESLWAVWVFGIIAGLLVPLILVMAGWTIQLLLSGQSAGSPDGPSSMPEQLTVGEFFRLQTSWLNASGSILRGVLGLVVLLIVMVALECVALITCYRSALHTSLEIAVEIKRKLFEKSNALAIEQGLSGQQEALRDMIFVHVPQIRETANAWYRAFPRHLVQSILLLALAASIQLLVTSLAMIAALILWVLFNSLDANRRKRRPVLYERARNASEQLASLCESSPLLASVHGESEIRNDFDGHLNAYRTAQLQLADGGILRSPTMLMTSAALAAFLMIVVAIRFLDDSTKLHFGEIITMATSVALGILGFVRFSKSYRRYKLAENAALQLATYLEQPTHERSETDRTQLVSHLPQITLEHVTIRNSSGQKLLEDVSATIRAGQMTAIVASEAVQATALAELILGFGKPASGRILLGDTDSTDFAVDALRKCSLWVASRGPVFNGTVEENLWAGAAHDATVDLMAFAKRMRVADAILNLSDGLQTLIGPNDDRILPDHLFRFGLTRALIKRPKLIVAQEPAVRVKASLEEETVDALQRVKETQCIVVVLPQRLSTLRAADQIVVVHEHRIAGIGSHVELLEQSDIYRHLNYMQFSPFIENGTAIE